MMHFRILMQMRVAIQMQMQMQMRKSNASKLLTFVSEHLSIVNSIEKKRSNASNNGAEKCSSVLNFGCLFSKHAIEVCQSSASVLFKLKSI